MRTLIKKNLNEKRAKEMKRVQAAQGLFKDALSDAQHGHIPPHRKRHLKGHSG